MLLMVYGLVRETGDWGQSISNGRHHLRVLDGGGGGGGDGSETDL